MRYVSAAGEMALPRPALPGGYQIDNAAVAIACLESLDGFTVENAHIAAGLAAVDWPGRLQRLSRGPLVDRPPAGRSPARSPIGATAGSI